MAYVLIMGHSFVKVLEQMSMINFMNYFLSTTAKDFVPSHAPFKNNAAAAKSLQSCPTLCDPIGGRPQGSPVPGILQARTLEWVAISFSNAWKWKVKVKSLSCVRLLVTPWTAAHQAPPSMGFFRQECWSGVPLPSPSRTISTLIFLFSQLSRGEKKTSQNYKA